MGQVKIGYINEIPRGEGRNFRQGEVEVAVFRCQSGQLFATQPRCPHAGGPLADGLLGGETVICPLHERSFALRSGKNLSGDCADLHVFPLVLENDGAIAVEICD